MTLFCCAAMEQHCGFRNEVFATLRKVMDRLSDTLCSLSNQTVASITVRTWILKCLN